jgi:hypothetical protein
MYKQEDNIKLQLSEIGNECELNKAGMREHLQ